MNKVIYTSYEVGYDEWASIDYFHSGTDQQYEDKTKYEIVSTKYKEITDGEDMTNGLKDWLWRVEVFSKKEEEDE